MQDAYPTRGAKAALIERQDPVVYWPPEPNAVRDDRTRLARFERDGYLLIPELFFKAESAALLQEAQQLRDRACRDRPQEAFFEPGSDALRSIFAVHRRSEVFARVCEDPRVLRLVQGILGDRVYVHQSRLNYKPAFRGREFYWHSDFETWHAEDGMPRMRAVSLSLSLTPSLANNGPLLVVPGSHQSFVACAGATPVDHYRQSLVDQRYGTPDETVLETLARRRGIKAAIGGAGSAVFFDCNIMHGSNGNITPFARTNLFVVYNAVSNGLQEPFGGTLPRPEFVAARDHVTALPRS